MKKIILLGASLCIALNSFAQKAFEGKIVYEISYDEVPEMLEPYISMLPKEATTYVKGDKVRFEQTTMGATTVNVVDNKAKTGFLLMDQFGEKTAYEMTKDDLGKSEQNPENNFDVTYSTETKEIAGYKCTRVDLKHKTENYTTTAWVTNEINSTNKTYPFLKGFALEYTMHNNDMVLTMKTKELKKEKVSNSYFEIPKDYTVKPYADLLKQMEEMQKMQGGGND